MANNKKKNNVNFVYDKKNNKIVTTKNITKKKLIVDEDENVVVTEKKQKLSQKERNKQKYYEKQKRYQQNNKGQYQNNKIIGTKLDDVPYKKNNQKKYQNNNQRRKQNNQDLNTKKEKKIVNAEEYIFQNENTIDQNILPQENEMENNGTLEITISDLKKKETIPEKQDENLETIDNSKKTKEKLFKRCVFEALIYSVVITIINVIAYFIFDYVTVLRLFDVQYMNIIVTILLSLIINFMVAILVDYLFTELWIKFKDKKDKKQEGEQNGDSWIKRRKNKRHIQNKE